MPTTIQVEVFDLLLRFLAISRVVVVKTIAAQMNTKKGPEKQARTTTNYLINM